MQNIKKHEGRDSHMETRTFDSKDIYKQALDNTNAGLFTAIKNDHYYYDEDLMIQKFKSGYIYFPSVYVEALNIHKNSGGEYIIYSDEEDEPRFTHYVDITNELSSVTHSVDSHENGASHVIGTYKTYREIPYWMSEDRLLSALRETKQEKMLELSDSVKQEEYHNRLIVFAETLITTFVLLLNTVLELPLIMAHSWIIQLIYISCAVLILTRFVGRSIRLYIDMKKFERKFPTLFNKHLKR